MKEIGSYIKTLFDSMGDGILFIDRDYKIVFANQTILNFFGKEEDDVIGKECYDVFYQFSIPCRAQSPSAVCPRYEVFKTGNKVVITHKYTLPDGTEKVFDVTASPLRDEKGEVIQVVEIFRDVTKQRQDEELLFKEKG